jgi:N-acetylmuramoyl-L-alanine amidase
VQTFTVHHTVTANADSTPAATVRAIYVAHTLAEGFGDIGYHLLVDQQGGLYEGRWSGADAIPVFGRRGGRPLMCNAAHVGGFNAGNVGIALLGDFTSVQPTPAARETLVGLLAGLCALTRVDPQAPVHYVNPISGATRDVDAIAGHRDWAATECPGNAFHPTLPDLRREVAALLRPGVPGL